jgi:hypothetical protein
MATLIKRLFGRPTQAPVRVPDATPAPSFIPAPEPAPRVKVRSVPSPFYVRASRKRDDVLVVGIEDPDTHERRRVALLRVEGGDVKLRTLNGNAREASSNSTTQQVIYLPTEDLTFDSSD